MFDEKALREAYANAGPNQLGGSSMWDMFTSTRELGSGKRSRDIANYKKLLKELDTERRSSSSSKPAPEPEPNPIPRNDKTILPAPKPTPTPIADKVFTRPAFEKGIAGKNGDMTTTIGDDNIITDSNIGNDNSTTDVQVKKAPTAIPATDEAIALRSEAKEKTQNSLDLLGRFGKTGDMTTSIGNKNTITDSNIGNDNSITKQSNAKERAQNHLANSGDTNNNQDNSVTNVDSNNKTQTNQQQKLLKSNSNNITDSGNLSQTMNSAIQSGKNGDMTFSVGDNNNVMGSSFGNDNSVTITGGSGDGMDNMMGLAAYHALNNNQFAKSQGELNGTGRSAMQIKQMNDSIGANDLAKNAYNMAGQYQQYFNDSSKAMQGSWAGDIFNYNAPEWKQGSTPSNPKDDTKNIFEKGMKQFS